MIRKRQLAQLAIQPYTAVMILAYYQWVAKMMDALEKKYPWTFNPFLFGRLGWGLATVLITAPVWLAGILIYFLPIPFDAQYTLWIGLLIVTIVFAIRTVVLASRRSRR